MKYRVLNKRGKFCAKIFLHYTDIVIFVLGYFIVTHPVCLQPMTFFWVNTYDTIRYDRWFALENWQASCVLLSAIITIIIVVIIRL